MDWYRELTPEQKEEFEDWWLLFSFSPVHITSDEAKRVALEAWKAAVQSTPAGTTTPGDASDREDTGQEPWGSRGPLPDDDGGDKGPYA